MLNSEKSPWKTLICNFPSSYSNFLQTKTLQELDIVSAELSIVNPGWNATYVVQEEISQTALQLHGIAAAVVSIFSSIFPTGLPAKYFMHARLAVLSRAWGSDGLSVLAPVADLFNHQEPTHIVISIVKKDSALSSLEVVMERSADKGEEVFNGAVVLLHTAIFSFILKCCRCRLCQEYLHSSIHFEFRLVACRPPHFALL
jgi:hypothetical protein